MKSWFRSRTFVLLASVALLAVTIFVLGSLSPADEDRKPRSNTERAATIASQATDALSRNETATAHSLALAALKLDADNAVARSVADASSDTQTRSSSGDATKSAPGSQVSATRDDSMYRAPSQDLSAMIPRSVATWVGGPATVAGADAVITLDPAVGSAAAGTVAHALLSVHDRGSVEAANRFPADVHAKLYGLNVSTARVGVIDSVRFGTDSSRVAAIVFTRGRFAFEIQVAVHPSVDPGSVKALALDLAKTFPATVK